MYTVADAVRELGGIASTAQLLAHRQPVDAIRMAVDYRKIIRIRRGWFASLDTPAEAIMARRIGGRLGCVSALTFHGIQADGRFPGLAVDEVAVEGVPVDHEAALHVAVAANASRLRLSPGRPVVIHWMRASPGVGALAVPVALAWRQYGQCQALRPQGGLDSL